MKPRSVLFVVPFLLLISVPLSASNMGVALRVQLTSTPAQLHFVSLPFLYDPGTAEALCQDLGAAGDVSGILRWDGASSVFAEYSCGSGVGDFALEEGTAHGVRVGLYRTVDQLVVGIHDDDFEFDFAPASGGNLHWISLPYHLALPDAGGQAEMVDAEDLCMQAGPEVFSVLRWNQATGRFATYVCGSEFIDAFELEQGVAYGLINADGETIQWQPTHY